MPSPEAQACAMTESRRPSPYRQTRNLAASAGRWSAQHRKKAILGWLAFVILAVFVGGSIGQRTLSDADFGIGESGRADKAINKAFPEDAGESILIQSKRYSAGDPRVQAGRRRDRLEDRGHQAGVST